MNERHAADRHPRPPRPARMLANLIVTTILRSRWHHLRSNRLLLLTFTGRRSGKRFTTPVRYSQEGETLRITIVYPWWKNLLGETMVDLLLRGQKLTGTPEVLSEQNGEAIVAIYLQRSSANASSPA